MTQLSFLEPIPHDTHGATWWVSNWQCRNFHGYFQSREGGRGNWCFQIQGFGDDDCTVMAWDHHGKPCGKVVPIDRKDQITINGVQYGRGHWSH